MELVLLLFHVCFILRLESDLQNKNNRKNLMLYQNERKSKKHPMTSVFMHINSHWWFQLKIILISLFACKKETGKVVNLFEFNGNYNKCLVLSSIWVQ